MPHGLSASIIAISLHLGIITDHRSLTRTIWHVEPRQEEFSVTADTSFAESSIRHHARNKVLHKIDVCHQFFGRNMFCERGKCFICSGQHVSIIVV